MNTGGRLARSGLTAVLSGVRPRTNHHRTSGAALSLSRRQSTAAGHAPDTDPGEKPRLRAIDLARKIQREKEQEKEKEKVKPRVEEGAQQRRVTELKSSTLQLQHVHPNVLAKHLRRGVLYRDKEVVIINKPYGVPVREDTGVTSISSVLPVLSKLMEDMKVKSDSQLFPSLGLEKDSAGALLLARSEEVVEKILDLQRNNQVQRKYWVVTVGVPVPSEGVIDIPIIEKQVTGSQPHFKMALSPLYKINDAGDGVTRVRGNRQAQPAATRYRVLDSGSGCSLVELEPLTGVKNQMRVHMALALSCPILGDHKYSNWAKLAPQKLPERVLRRLGLEQSKIRHLPLHVLARQLTLTLTGTKQTDVDVTCPLPKYFTQTLHRLQLTLPEKQDDK